MTFEKGNTYNLYDPDLSNFVSKTQLDTLPQNRNLVYTFLNDMKYNINTPGDKKVNQYHQ